MVLGCILQIPPRLLFDFAVIGIGVHGGGLRVTKPIRYIVTDKAMEIFCSLKPFVFENLTRFRETKVSETDLVMNFELLKGYVVGHLAGDPASVLEHRDDEVLEVADSEPEPEKLPLDDGEPLPDDIFLKMKDREPLLPEGSYMKFDESGASDLLGESPLILNEAVEARETKKQTTIGAGEAEENDDAMGQECEAPDDGVAQGCDPTQDGVAQGCDPTEDDGVAQKCDDGARVAQVCDPAQDDGVAQVCDPAQEVAQVDGPLPSSFKTCALVPDPETIHSQVLLRSASELEAAFLPEAHEVPVPDTPLKTPDRGSEDVSTTPSTRKVLRNTSSYKAVSSPVPFLSETAFDVLMGCNDAEGADSSAAGSAQMVMPKVLFPEPTDPAEVVPESAEAPDVEMHDNPYSRELEVVAVPKRVKEGSVAIPTPEKPDPKKAKLEEQARVRRQQAQETWDSVVYPLREKAPDAMPVSYSVFPPTDIPVELDMPAEDPKSIVVILN
ncbi:unnamed protein product, partial [Symbiodinium sp. KB8]